jgi:Protein of unknown function (DUF3071)
MRQLRFVGLAEDGASLLLESPTGESYRLALDERVRAACRGDLIRLGQIEIETDNPLRPREIQARVRAGESAEQVAASAGMALDRVLRFAYPVLQERSRVVAQARSTSVRPKAAEQLGDLVEERLVSRGTDAATLAWDSWRRDDGRWAVRLSWRHGDRAHAAHWSLDLGRRALQAEDPAAEQLSAQEFHARTITAVTPLAVAARAATEAPAPPRGTRPAGGAHAGSPAASPADRPRPGQVGSARTPAAGAHRESAAAEPAADPASADGPRPSAAGSARASSTPPDRRPPDRSARMGSGGGERPGTERPTTGTGAGRAAAERREAGGRRARQAGPGGDADEDGEAAEAAEEGRIAAGGGTIPLVDTEGEDDRSRRATVPSWDDILLGVRRRH